MLFSTNSYFNIWPVFFFSNTCLIKQLCQFCQKKWLTLLKICIAWISLTQSFILFCHGFFFCFVFLSYTLSAILRLWIFPLVDEHWILICMKTMYGLRTSWLFHNFKNSPPWKNILKNFISIKFFHFLFQGKFNSYSFLLPNNFWYQHLTPRW